MSINRTRYSLENFSGILATSPWFGHEAASKFDFLEKHQLLFLLTVTSTTRQLKISTKVHVQFYKDTLKI